MMKCEINTGAFLLTLDSVTDKGNGYLTVETPNSNIRMNLTFEQLRELQEAINELLQEDDDLANLEPAVKIGKFFIHRVDNGAPSECKGNRYDQAQRVAMDLAKAFVGSRIEILQVIAACQAESVVVWE